MKTLAKTKARLSALALRVVRRNRAQAEPIPRPIRTHGCATFWYNHGCPDRVGVEINVAMMSGKTAVFRLSKIEPATGVDWSWYDFDFVRYLPSPNAADQPTPGENQ